MAITCNASSVLTLEVLIMSKAKALTNPNKASSVPGSNYSRPTGAWSLATFDSPVALAHAILYGNRATRRLAEKNQASYKHRKLIGGAK